MSYRVLKGGPNRGKVKVICGFPSCGKSKILDTLPPLEGPNVGPRSWRRTQEHHGDNSYCSQKHTMHLNQIGTHIDNRTAYGKALA